MLKIKIPNNNMNERKYIIDILLGEFLGLEYEIIVVDNSDSWEMILENDNNLIIEDNFFNKFQKDLAYLKEKNIPKKIEFSKNDFIVEDDIPIIYGTSNLKLAPSGNTFGVKMVNFETITCGIDIFASSFFMLTRWEEYVNKTRDNHERFPAYASLAFKQNFLDRPIVNEYIEMLKNMLLALGLQAKLRTRHFQMYLTHDVDVPLKYPTLTSGFREIVADVLKRKDFKLAKTNLLSKIKTVLKIEKDPFDTFDYLMDISEKNGVKSYFFFMAKGETTYENKYKSNDKFILKLIEKIKSRGHHIGIHPTYNAFNNTQQFEQEKKELETNLKQDITFGREHYLRFEVPTTWQVWENNGMKWDSTLSFSDKEGFRCGVCYAYNVFNILTQQKLNLKERPLIVMDGSFITYQKNIESTTMTNNIQALLNKVKKYDGDFVFLWHNSSFNTSDWKNYQIVYKRLFK